MPVPNSARAPADRSYAAIDHLTVMQVVGGGRGGRGAELHESAVPMLVVLPPGFAERFAKAFAEVLHALRDAAALEGVGAVGVRQPATERALKMLLVLPALLLRHTPSSAPFRMGAALAQRFTFWETRACAEVVAGWGDGSRLLDSHGPRLPVHRA